MLKAVLETTIGSKSKRDLKDYLPTLRNINKLERWALLLADEDFQKRLKSLKMN